jgi:hypothetical protein
VCWGYDSADDVAAFGAIATAGRYTLRVVKDYDIDADKDIVRVDIGLV